MTPKGSNISSIVSYYNHPTPTESNNRLFIMQMNYANKTI